MIIIEEMSIRDFDAWSEAVNTKSTIIDKGKTDEFDLLIDELYPEGIDETKLNDMLWFESEWIYEMLGIDTENEEVISE